MPLNVYLNFNGNCREVFEFYRSVFGGEFNYLGTFRELPEDMGVPEDEMDNVLHVSFDIGGTTLMGSDVPSNWGMPIEMGNNFSISLQTESREQTEDLFAKISEGGNVTMPLGDMFWGDYFGACSDKFGINWMVSNTDAQASS
ncbi:MAG: VOC family protein [Chloroflexi bacterium]|nr:VOC family protein [Chloroflexota bacterium]